MDTNAHLSAERAARVHLLRRSYLFLNAAGAAMACLAVLLLTSGSFAQDEPDCDNPATVDIYKIELLSGPGSDCDEGQYVTFTYKISKTNPEGGIGNPNLSHWVLGLLQIDCLADGFDFHDLVHECRIASTLAGLEDDASIVDCSIGLDPTTGLDGVKIDVPNDLNTNQPLYFSITFDQSVLQDGCCLVEGCVDVATKGGQRDVIAENAVLGPVCRCDEPPLGCETAFAYGGDDATCFIEFGFRRWGWTNGPLEEGIYVWDIYAGAGQCDLDKGTIVGTLTVEYADGVATVTYCVDSGCVMTETHLYVGNDPFPTDPTGADTVAPGQYPHTADHGNGVECHTVVVDGLSGDIFVIAHAVVCCGDED